MEFKEFMSEKKPISRWTILKAGLAGAMCGVIIGVLFSLSAVLI